MAKSNLSIEERFFQKVVKSDGCWTWTSATWGSGYGFFWTGGERRNEYAHRFSWELANGQRVPARMVIMHSCDNKLCVNPAHLFLGTHQDNANDKVSKKRHPTGENNKGGGKLTWDKVREIRASALGCHRAAKEFGVSSTTIKSIRRGKIWREAA